MRAGNGVACGRLVTRPLFVALAVLSLLMTVGLYYTLSSQSLSMDGAPVWTRLRRHGVHKDAVVQLQSFETPLPPTQSLIDGDALEAVLPEEVAVRFDRVLEQFPAGAALVQTEASGGFSDWLENWWCHYLGFEQHGFAGVVVIAFTRELYDRLSKLVARPGRVAVFLPEGVTNDVKGGDGNGGGSGRATGAGDEWNTVDNVPKNFNTKLYLSTVKSRNILIHHMLRRGFSVFHVDADTVPMRAFDEFPDQEMCDVSYSIDDEFHTHSEEFFDFPVTRPPEMFCCGVTYIASNARTIRMFDTWLEVSAKFADSNDQTLLQTILAAGNYRGMATLQPMGDSTVFARQALARSERIANTPSERNAALRVCTLHPLEYPSGHLAFRHPRDFLRHTNELQSPRLRLIHFNFFPTHDEKVKNIRLLYPQLWKIGNDRLECDRRFSALHAP